MEYSFKDAYNLSSLNNEEMTKLVERFKTDNQLFEKYSLYNSVSWKAEKPDKILR